ncbi:MAG: glycosyltransferase family 2 protein [Edaphocola sp.]
MDKLTLAIVIPCYNEEEVLTETTRQLGSLLQNLTASNVIGKGSYVLYVDDGSRDATWQLICNIHEKDARFKGLKLSRNFGHQNALLAGLYSIADYDVCISIDADLQDDLAAIPKMMEAYRAGNDVVYGVRDDRSSDTFFKRLTALGFYKLMDAMGVEQVYNHADYRLISAKAMAALRQFGETNLYLRGMVPLVGFKSSKVFYKRGARLAGESKYPLKKMLAFAWSGISSTSIKPLRFVTFCGFSIFILSIFLSIYVLVAYFLNNAVVGWASTVLPIYFLGGIQLLCIGLLGEYVAKIYNEVKQRPRFIIEQHLN